MHFALVLVAAVSTASPKALTGDEITEPNLLHAMEGSD